MELLSRLQGHQPRTAERLAADMGVTTRTVRRDIARLRDLGYPRRHPSRPRRRLPTRARRRAPADLPHPRRGHRHFTCLAGQRR
ncbi:HTH domain-containing protein [Rhodococcus sp. BS-15]|uniref:HTH domain-containing protein n=1 Tax=Rhodococcus sp. BS-15 TaxID=1304954 RepID=UPI0035B558EC